LAVRPPARRESPRARMAVFESQSQACKLTDLFV
jgi:hypothetical protein